MPYGVTEQTTITALYAYRQTDFLGKSTQNTSADKIMALLIKYRYNSFGVREQQQQREVNHLRTLGVAPRTTAKPSEEMADTRIARFHRIRLCLALPHLRGRNERPIDFPGIRHDLGDPIAGH